MGSRLLAEWVANPLTDAASIQARLDAVEELVGDQSLGDDLHERLAAGLRRGAAAGPRHARAGPARAISVSWAARCGRCRRSRPS